ncbi:MAG TPA: amidohydrolase family protein [Myxococcota bacterium]|nr:amidohydrolase family protein [Myxococcota bacterium]
MATRGGHRRRASSLPRSRAHRLPVPALPAAARAAPHGRRPRAARTRCRRRADRRRAGVGLRGRDAVPARRGRARAVAAGSASALDRFAVHPGRLVGIRHLIHDEPDPDWVVQPRVLESLALLAERDLVFDLSAFQPRHLEHVATFAERVPRLRVVVCHYGMPRVDQQQWEPWASAFARAAQNPNAVVKISGLDLFLGGPDPARTRPYFEHAIQCYGAERLLWASNWPVSLQLRGYTELLDAARVQLEGMDTHVRDAILGANARRVYRLTDGG